MATGCWAKINKNCRLRTTWRPPTRAGSPGLPPPCHWRFLPRRPDGTTAGRCTHAGSGPSRVRRRVFLALGDSIPLATFHVVGTVKRYKNVPSMVIFQLLLRYHGKALIRPPSCVCHPSRNVLVHTQVREIRRSATGVMPWELHLPAQLHVLYFT